jgi:hypothetical protein
MIEQGLLKAERSKVIWQSAPLPNDAVAVSAALFKDKPFVKRLQDALAEVGPLLKTQPVTTALRQAAHRATLVSVVHQAALLPVLSDRVIGMAGARVAFDLPQEQVDAQVRARLYRPCDPPPADGSASARPRMRWFTAAAS